MSRTRAFMTRRRFFRALLAGVPAIAWIGRAPAQSPDRGIGGTGVVPEPSSDRGIGGTGVIGTIQGFGSVIVNDLRISYPPDVSVTIDEAVASIGDLRIGHVATAWAEGGDRDLATRRIAVSHEVVGTISRASGRRLTVLGQSVRAPLAGWRRGDRIAVSGLRRPDGTIMASLIERSTASEDRVAGVAHRRADGSVAIGGLAIAGLAADAAEGRLVVSGVTRKGRLWASRARRDTPDAAIPDVDTYLIETFARRNGNAVESGSGYKAVFAGSDETLPEHETVRAILTARVGETGALVVEGARLSNGDHHGGARGGSGERAPAGRGPAGFGQGGPESGFGGPDGDAPGFGPGAPRGAREGGAFGGAGPAPGGFSTGPGMSPGGPRGAPGGGFGSGQASGRGGGLGHR